MGKGIIIFLIILVGVLVLGGGVYAYKHRNDESKPMVDDTDWN